MILASMQYDEHFANHGWVKFPADPDVTRWVDSVRKAAIAAASDPANAHWLRCGGTWFVGVDALLNDEFGRVGNGPPLAGNVMRFIREDLSTSLPLHRAQISVCYKGYPQPSPEETETAYRYRQKRDAAHVDGLLALGLERRRFLREPHAYILGLPLTEADTDASPLVVWDGSHRILRKAFEAAFAQAPGSEWESIDITEPYQAARREVFASCLRIELPARPGEAILMHRHLLHGVAPWAENATASMDGRMVAYFRPVFESMADWLAAA
jgi:hypothetical protein